MYHHTSWHGMTYVVSGASFPTVLLFAILKAWDAVEVEEESLRHPPWLGDGHSVGLSPV